MPTPQNLKAIVYFDICNYSNMDLRKQLQSVKKLERAIKRCLGSLKGHAIVEGGDSFAIDFKNLSEAVLFAKKLSTHVRKMIEPPIPLRIGINIGEVAIQKSINRVKNIYGVGIDFAARLASCCEPNQILIAASSLDEVAPRGDPIRDLVNGPGTYRLKHGVDKKVYNLYSKGVFGISELPLKNKVNDSSFLVLIGDRRETSPKTIGDIFLDSPSIDDLSQLFKFDWPADILLRGDKIMCWSKNTERSLVSQRNLFVLGSPKVNIAALVINTDSIFRFHMDKMDVYKSEIQEFHLKFSSAQPNDEAFNKWYSEQREMLSERYPQILIPSSIEDPLRPGWKCAKSTSESFGLISFAAHPCPDDAKSYAIFIAGLDLTATIALTNHFFSIDFSDRPFGGVIRVNKPHNVGRPWYEDPHHGELATKGNAYWMTPAYDGKSLLASVDGSRKELVARLLQDGSRITMARIQSLLRKK